MCIRDSLSTPFPIQRLSNEAGVYPAMPSDQLGNTTDYVELFAESLQCSIRDTLRTAKGLPIERSYFRDRAEYMEARDWFLSSFPLLGAVASSFRIVDDRETVQRMDIPEMCIRDRHEGGLIDG